MPATAAPPAQSTATPANVPEGYSAVAISPGAPEGLRVCVLARRQPESVGGTLVVLRETMDARVFLGCVCDAAGRVHQWVEVWVQTVDGVGATQSAARDVLTNAVLDKRWEQMVGCYDHADRPLLIRTGAEGTSPSPLWIDGAKGEPFTAVEAGSGAAWKLCMDDAALAAAGLPAYSGSLHRYLWTATKDGPFVPVTAGAPTNERTRSTSDALGKRVSEVTAMNPGAGRLMVRAMTPHGYEAFLALIGAGFASGAKPRVGVPHGKGVIDLDAAFGVSPLDGGGLFMGHEGRWGRLIESLHLKLRLLADCVDAVRAFSARTQRPLLNLGPESFQVRMGEAARGLPQWWTARAVLVNPGDAVALPIQTSDAAYFVSASASRQSIYRPESVGVGVTSGRGQLRIRQIVNQPGGGGGASGELILEGTLSTQERVHASRSDLVWLRTSLANQRVDLYGRLEAETALASGELRLRTLPQRLPEGVVAAINAAQGVPLADVAFEIVPLLSTPCDLYALGVLAVRTLLVGRGVTLPVALDEVLSLGRQVAQLKEGEGAGKPVWERVGAAFKADKRWLESLGPHRLTEEQVAPDEALGLIPSEVWFRVLATIIPMFPGLSTESRCRDLGDARQGGLHLVFDVAAEGFADLMRRTRSLIVIDWNANREVHAVIRRFATGVGGKKG